MTTGASNPVIRRIGTRAVLVELLDLMDVMAWHSALVADPLPGQTEVIAAARTVLIKTISPRAALDAASALTEFRPGHSANREGSTVTIDVVYDGEDLRHVAATLRISVEELIGRHTSERWLAAFGGFAPGFTYCVPTEGDWDIPRRDSPRTDVPAGSVALAGNFSAVYPRQSPGGWQLIGHTNSPMWDSHAEPPALLSPGDTVIYRAVRESVAIDDSPELSSSTQQVTAQPAIRVTSVGLQTLFQDVGRPGHGDIGVNSSGAVDRGSAWTANNVAGNHRSATLLENIGGLSLDALIDIAVVVTGARSEVIVTDPDGHQSEYRLAAPIQMTAGSNLHIEPPTLGMRNYLAVRGGFTVEQTLGSSSTDILSGLGPDPVSEGDVLRVGDLAIASVGQAAPNPLLLTQEVPVVRCVRGPRHDWFSPQEQNRFTTTDWVVSSQSNRVGLRLEAPEGTEGLQRSQEGELASEGMISGSIQIPPNGLPVVFMADHPVTGGYPVIGTVLAEDLDLVAQLSPGSAVQFCFVNPDTFIPEEIPS